MRRVGQSIPPAILESIDTSCSRCRALARAAHEVAVASDTAQALRSILSRAVEATGAERAFLVSARREPGRQEPVILARLSRRPDGSEQPSRTVFQRALAAPRALVCPEGAADPRLADAPSVRELRLRTVIAAPVRRSDGSAAALVIDSAALNSSPAASEALVSGFAALVALAGGSFGGEAAAAPAAEPAGGAKPRDALVGRSPAFRAAINAARRIAATSLPVLIQGESGTGKESLARLIHDASPRRSGPFVALNCAAVPEGLIEAELFGAVRGAFTGAERERAGLLRTAHGGTLFLDEVGDMPLAMQAKLLRVLQEGRVRAVGAERELDVDVRVVAATHQDLEALLASHRFRPDLYWRLAVAKVRLPPLRERLEDFAELAAHLIDRLSRCHRLPAARLSEGALSRLRSHDWPGNVRELEAVLARAILSHGGEEIGGDGLALAAPLLPQPIQRPARLEEEMIRDALAAAGTAAEAARRIGWSRQKLYRRMNALGITPRRSRALTPADETPAAVRAPDRR